MNSSDPSQNDGKSAVIVLTPVDDDPVRQISSGDHPHTTLVYIEDAPDEQMNEVRAAVEGVAGSGFDTDPLDRISGEGTLGEHGSTVYFLDASFSLGVRDRLLDNETISTLEAQTFPHWTPHMTIGDPENPATDPGVRPEGIVYDRISIFRNGEVEEYPLTFTEPSMTASAEVDPDEEAAVAELQDLGEVEIPWHGVLAPEGVTSSDGRRFAENSLTTRNLPLPLMWTPASWGRHDGSVVVARIDKVWREDGLIKAEGVFDTSENAYEVIRLIASGILRGVSVDVTDIAVGVENDELVEFESGELAAATIVHIPAFKEAYVALGSWDDPVEVDEPQESVTASAAMAISEKEWDGDSSRFSLEEYHRSCIVHLHDGEPESKSDCKLPIREPNGDLSRAGVHAAAARLNQTDAPDEQISKAKASLRSAYKELGEETPEVVASGGSEEFVGDKLLPKHMDGPGWITDPKPTNRITSYWVDGRGAAKIRWGQGGDFNRCRRQLAKYVQNPSWLAGLCANLHHRALGVWPGQHSAEGMSITASAAPSVNIVESQAEALPAENFQDPGLTAPTPLTVTEDGRVFGHLATWDTCHIGFAEECTTAPRSATNYAYFRTGEVTTTEGPIAVGSIVMGGPHANPRAQMKAAWHHYAATSSALADVAVGEDTVGIWVSGMLRPGLSPEEVRAVKASALSGDWRAVRTASGGRNLELVAALAVNVPGFPIPRVEFSSDQHGQVALVAAGVIAPDDRKSRLAEAKMSWKKDHLARLRDELSSFKGV